MIIGYVGGMSSGKTAIMTKDLFEDGQDNVVVRSNYWLRFKNTPITDEDIMQYADADEQLHNCSIGLDEIYLYLDSRNSGNKRNKIYSYFALQTSKRDVRLRYTAQMFGSVDKRIRENTHQIVTCYPLFWDREHKKKPRLLVPDMTRKIAKADWPFYYTLVIRMTKHVFGMKESWQKSVEIVHTPDYFDLYDTQEIIAAPKDIKKEAKIDK